MRTQGQEPEPLTMEALKEISASFKRPELPKSHKPSRFERLMNRLGWYRQTTVYIVRESQLLNPFPIRWNGFDRTEEP